MNKFNVISGKICVTDPCYKRGTWCANFDVPAKNGVWVAKVTKNKEGRIKALYAHHEHFGESKLNEVLPNEVGVDSGQAGIFDSSIYPDGERDYRDENSFYKKVCNLTDKSWGIYNNAGVVSRTGYGDGGYEAKCAKHNNEIVSVKITFIRGNN